MNILLLDYQQDMALRWPGLLLLAVALGGLGLAIVYYVDLNDRAASWESRLEQVARSEGMSTVAGRAGQPESGDMAVQVSRANEVLRRLTLPWNALFRAVESAAGKDVALLAMEPDLEKQQVKISGEARDFAALLNYVTRLEEQAVFGPVHLQGHQVQQQDPDRPVRFSLLAVWRERS
jgi:hypothetical protein